MNFNKQYWQDYFNNSSHSNEAKSLAKELNIKNNPSIFLFNKKLEELNTKPIDLSVAQNSICDSAIILPDNSLLVYFNDSKSWSGIPSNEAIDFLSFFVDDFKKFLKSVFENNNIEVDKELEKYIENLFFKENFSHYKENIEKWINKNNGKNNLTELLNVLEKIDLSLLNNNLETKQDFLNIIKKTNAKNYYLDLFIHPDFQTEVTEDNLFKFNQHGFVLFNNKDKEFLNIDFIKELSDTYSKDFSEKFSDVINNLLNMEHSHIEDLHSDSLSYRVALEYINFNNDYSRNFIHLIGYSKNVLTNDNLIEPVSYILEDHEVCENLNSNQTIGYSKDNENAFYLGYYLAEQQTPEKIVETLRSFKKDKKLKDLMTYNGALSGILSHNHAYDLFNYIEKNDQEFYEEFKDEINASAGQAISFIKKNNKNDELSDNQKYVLSNIITINNKSRKPFKGVFFDIDKTNHEPIKDKTFFSVSLIEPVFSVSDVINKTPVYDYIMNDLFASFQLNINDLNELEEIHKKNNLKIKEEYPQFSKKHYNKINKFKRKIF